MNIRLILVLLCVHLTAGAQNANANKAWKIYARYVENSGGIAHWEALQSYRRVSHRTDELEVTCIAQKPDQFQLIFEKGAHHVVKSYDGTNGWLEIDGTYFPMRPGEEIEMAEEPEFYEDLIKAREKGFTLDYEGKDRVGGLVCHKIKMIKSAEDTQWYWINAKNYRLEMVGEYSQDPAHDGILYTTRFDDYRDINGYQIPFTELLIHNGVDTLGIYYESMEVNPKLTSGLFSYVPKDQRNCVRWLQDDFPVKLAPAYTFVQRTVHYHDGVQDTAIWYEALVYPDLFRIDFGGIESGNSNLNVHDTLYAFRKHVLKASVYDPQLFLFAEGSMYTDPVDSIMVQLDRFLVDTTAFALEQSNGQRLLVFGDASNTRKPAQFKIDQDTGLLRYQKERLDDGRWLELDVTETQQIGPYMFPKSIEIFIEGELVQRELYIEIDVNPDFPEGFFDPEHALENHWYTPK